jgi:SulP family sulfate permease
LLDLTVAIEIGMLLAVFLFIRKMIRFSDVSTGPEAIEEYSIPPGVEVFEITGPLFFGAAYKFKDAIKFIKSPPKILIIRMRQVPIIDATGIKTIQEVYKESTRKGARLILSEVRSRQVMEELKEARLLFAIGKANVTDTFGDAVERSKLLLGQDRIN